MSGAIHLAEPLFELAVDRHKKGRLRDAATAYARVLTLAPSHAGSHHMMSVLARQAGQNELALEGLRRAIASAPREPQYREDLVDLLHTLKHTAEAAACLREMCVLWPDRADLHARRGIALREAGQDQEAVDALRISVGLDPEDADAQCQLGLGLLGLGEAGAATASFTEAIRLRPDFEAAHNNLGLALMQVGRFSEAEDQFREALRLSPDRALTYINLGNVLRFLGRLDAAEVCLRTALHLQPGYPEAHFSLGSLLMLDGRLSEGWPEIEWQSSCFPQRELPGEPWNGEALHGRTLLLYADQGFGDSIQYCRYVPALAACENVIFEVPKWLTRLMGTLEHSGTLVPRDAAKPDYDLKCPLSRLPLFAGTTLDTIPAAVPYLHAEPDAVAAWHRRLAPLNGLRVGLVWAGNPAYRDDRRRSVTLRDLAPLVSVPGVVFISLQKLLRDDDATPPPPGMILHDWTAELGDFADTAALVMALDLVISVDTAVAHLTGALGKPVWLLNRYDTDWRWLLDRDDSPWYPTTRQFRQTDPVGWDAPILAVRDALSRLAATPCPSSCSG